MTGLDMQIERYRIKTGLDYIDCVTDFAEEKGMCYFEIAEQLHPNIIKNIEFEAKKRHMMKDNEGSSPLY